MNAVSTQLQGVILPSSWVEIDVFAGGEADVAINDFDRDARFCLAQHPSSDLFGRPLLVDHQGDDFLPHPDTESTMFAHPSFAFVALTLGNAVMITVPPFVTLQLPVNGAVMHVYRICDVFYRHFLFQQYRNCVSLCRG